MPRIEFIVPEEPFFPPLPWLSVPNESFSPKARRIKRKVKRSSLGTKPVTFPLPEVFPEDLTPQASELEKEGIFPEAQYHIVDNDQNDGSQHQSQCQNPPECETSICQSIVLAKPCQMREHRNECLTQDRAPCRQAICEKSPTSNFCKRCEIRLEHMNRLSADPEARRKQRDLHRICWTLASCRAQALGLPDSGSDFHVSFMDHGYNIEGPLSKHSQYDLYFAMDFSSNRLPIEDMDGYEVRAYKLSDISSKTKAYRIRDLKRQQARPTYVRSFDCQGKTWVLNYISHAKHVGPLPDDIFPLPPLTDLDWLYDETARDSVWRRDIIERSVRMKDGQMVRFFNTLTLIRDPSQNIAIKQLIYYARSLQTSSNTQGGQLEVENLPHLNLDLNGDVSSIETEFGDSIARLCSKQWPSASPVRILSGKYRYCICNGLGQGIVISCWNYSCSRTWYHLDCIGLEKLPANPMWYCDECVRRFCTHASSVLNDRTGQLPRNPLKWRSYDEYLSYRSYLSL